MTKAPSNILGTLLLVLLISAAVILSSVESKPAVQSSSTETSKWLSRANNAWRYFQVGSAVDNVTGLCSAGIGYPFFTDWDLATYLFSIMDAAKLGILSNGGPWGAIDRINKVVNWLKNRLLTADNLPYLWYDARTGDPLINSGPTNAADHGDLLVALHCLKEYRPDLAETIDNIVKTRENTGVLASHVSAQKIYDYYVANGFSFFGFDSDPHIANALSVLETMMSGPKVDVYGVPLPVADITCEPLLLGMFHLGPNPVLAELTWRVYLAHERRYAATGKFTAFSEGNTALIDWPGYVYEWVVTGRGTAWEIEPTAIAPIVFFKVAIAFDALYHTSYAEAMVNYLSGVLPDTPNGYYDGVDENGRLVNTTVDRTNGFVISSARYVTEALPAPKLSDFPAPFIDASKTLRVTYVVGDSAPHGPYGWSALTWDNLGAIKVTDKLSQLCTNGTAEAMLDTWVAVYNETSGSVNVLWEEAKNNNSIVVGGPAVNMLAYYFERFDGIPFYLMWTGGFPILHSALTDKNYTFSWGQLDYALIACFQCADKCVLSVWGLTAYGTLAACQLLQNFDSVYSGMLTGRAVIIKWTDLDGNGNVDLADGLTVVEVWS